MNAREKTEVWDSELGFGENRCWGLGAENRANPFPGGLVIHSIQACVRWRARGERPLQVVKTQGEVGPDGRLRLDVPVELPAGAVELVLIVGSTPQLNGSKYDFAGVVGKLQWQGDALEEQRQLRN